MSRIKFAFATLVGGGVQVSEFWISGKLDCGGMQGVPEEARVRMDGWQGIQVGNDPTSV